MSAPFTGIERLRSPMPPGFDPRRHIGALLELAARKHGEGWEVESIDSEQRVVHLARQSTVTEVRDEGSEVLVLGLAKGTRPTDGDRIAVKFEDAHPGYTMVRFDPFLGRAQMRRLSEEEVRARAAIANALSVKPWLVQVRATPDGGFEVDLPASYTPSRHDEKLTEVAEAVVGAPGWFVRTDPAALRATIVPSAPPTFPPMVHTPMDRLGQDWLRTPFGWNLPAPGQEVGEVASVDWRSSAHLLLGGTPGSGKSVAINAILADQLASGASVVVLDDAAKAVDFLWMRDMCRPGGWGCDSLAGAVAALAMVYEEGRRRAEVLARTGYVNWLDMPDGERFTPLFVLVDEVSALLVTDKVPTGIPKTHPLVQEVLETNLLKVTLGSLISKIVAEQRFVGVRMVLSTQVTNANTGVPPSLRAKIGHKLLMGSNPSRSARAQMFSDETAVPTVPANVQADPEASRGTGASDLEGAAPRIVKAFFASTGDYRRELLRRGVPTTDHPAPTGAQIARYAPSLQDEGSEDRPPSRLDGGGFGGADGRDVADRDRLRGAARAAHEHAVQMAQAERASG